MKCTVQQIQQAIPAFNELAGRKDIPAKPAYSVAKLIKAATNELKDFDEERTKIFTDAGCALEDIKDEKGEVVTGQDGKPQQKYAHADQAVLDGCVKKAGEMAEAEVEINALAINLDQFVTAKGDELCIEPWVLLSLDWAIKQPE